MEVQLTPEQEAQLDTLATATGRGTDALLQEAVDKLLADSRWFNEQVQAGIEHADRGEFIEEQEMDARVAGWFQT